jgi:hypothetical protein
MVLTSLEHITSFVAGLELGEIPGVSLEVRKKEILLGDSSKAGQEAGYVDGGSLISFASGVSGQSQSDVLNSTLLAQLAANKKYDREKDTENWYKFYRSVLENVGWVVGSFEFQRYEASKASGTIDKIALELLAAIAVGNEIAVVNKTLETAKSLANKASNDGRIKLFESSTHSGSAGNFQIAAASESGNVMAMKIGAFYFKAQQTVTNLLFFDFSSSGATIYKGSQTVSLNKEVYGNVRQQIVGKLGDKAKSYIEDLEL